MDYYEFCKMMDVSDKIYEEIEKFNKEKEKSDNPLVDFITSFTQRSF